MDLSFAAQALAVADRGRATATACPACTRSPPRVDQEVARLKLASLGIEIDALTEAQERYLRPFR